MRKTKKIYTGGLSLEFDYEANKILQAELYDKNKNKVGVFTKEGDHMKMIDLQRELTESEKLMISVIKEDVDEYNRKQKIARYVSALFVNNSSGLKGLDVQLISKYANQIKSVKYIETDYCYQELYDLAESLSDSTDPHIVIVDFVLFPFILRKIKDLSNSNLMVVSFDNILFRGSESDRDKSISFGKALENIFTLVKEDIKNLSWFSYSIDSLYAYGLKDDEIKAEKLDIDKVFLNYKLIESLVDQE